MSRHGEFKEALGAAGRKLVVVSSTWHDDSLFGLSPNLVSELMTMLPANRYCFALILHPAIWITHGQWQVRTWLRDAIDAGLRLVPYERGWQEVIVATDCVIGDYGSVSLYANMLGVPTCFYSVRKENVNRRLTVVQEALKAPQVKNLEEIVEFVMGTEENPGRAAGIPAAREKAFANLGTSIDKLSDLLYERLGLAREGKPTRPLLLHRPNIAIREPQSFRVGASEGESGTSLYPASLPSLDSVRTVLISTDREENYRICQNAAGAIIEGSQSRNNWRARFPLASYALVEEHGKFTLLERGGGSRDVGPLERTEAFGLIAGAIASSRR